MQIDGKLTKWNDDRGFGFITSNLGGQEIFIHVSAFPKDGRRPRIGEPLSFEIEAGKDGKKRAVAVSRPARVADAQRRVRPPDSRHARKGRGRIGRLAPLLAAVVLGIVGYGEYSRRAGKRAVAADIGASESAGASAAQGATRFVCDGRTHCSQMTSCAEATYFLNHCPNVTMDGNRDGVPCEQQWCGK
ncbi:MAG: cold shock domain-containing protein [Sterolibacteriaceae bacterium]|nr:cold shock domain-containing protein [Candidatus Methylophosphatis haderslevensis]